MPKKNQDLGQAGDTRVSEKELLPLLGISSRSLFKLRKDGKIPFTKINDRLILYDVDAVLKALEKYNRIAK